ncbi:MAG: tRNA lysidine(34) synthetase TilS [Eubacteriales bacterium]|nr:tRNA lysidine(34) synthetase TilS [Eubacteriales bacterium]
MTHEHWRLIGETELAACACSPKERVLVALSGGADSTALLLSLNELYIESKIGGLFAAHLNHGIRGESALRDQQFCAALCERLSIPFDTETADVPAYAKEHGQSLEQAGRELRYAFLERARIRFQASVIATAHHQDDQAETLLLHLIRGSGLIGLCGMQPRSGNLIRPMLGVEKTKIPAYLAERGEAYCQDETNEENEAMRNRVRHELMPMLATLNPSIAQTLSKTSELLARDEALLTSLANEAEDVISLGRGLGRKALCEMEEPIASRIVRKRIYESCGEVAQADIRRVLALLSARTGTKIELHGNVTAWTDAQTLWIGEHPDVAQYEMVFVPEGETVTPRGTFFSEYTSSWKQTLDGVEAYLDRNKLPQDLVVRSRREGDRFYPLGAPGERKLSDVLTDKKIAKEMRDLPLLCHENQVYYAAGLTISDRVKVTPETREILHIICNRGTRD